MQKKYCTSPEPVPTSQEAQASSSSGKTSGKSTKSTTKAPDPLIPQFSIIKNGQKSQAPNQLCELLCLNSTIEENIKASRLQDFIESELNMYMTKVSL